jgi:hypothetical protein
LRSFIVKTRKVGDCIVVTLPKELVQATQLGADMSVEITVKKCPKQGSTAPKDNDSLGPYDPWKLLE